MTLIFSSINFCRFQYENDNHNQIDNLNNYDNKRFEGHRSTDYIMTSAPRRERINYFKEMFSNRSKIPTEISNRISLGIIFMICKID